MRDHPLQSPSSDRRGTALTRKRWPICRSRPMAIDTLLRGGAQDGRAAGRHWTGRRSDYAVVRLRQHRQRGGVARGVAVFVDIRPDTLNQDEALAESAITPRTRAILPGTLYATLFKRSLLLAPSTMRSSPPNSTYGGVGITNCATCSMSCRKQGQTLNLMGEVWKVTTAEEGEQRLEQLARYLERDNATAAASLRDCLATTNMIESPQSGIARRTGNVTRWRDLDMVERWVASAWLLTEKHFRKLDRHRSSGGNSS